MKRALIAMSGGVDSSVAACLMVENGYECMGVTMKLYDNDDAGIPKGNTCCSLEDVEDARSVAFTLGMPYQVFNFKDDFRDKVINRFISAYEHGETPNPCIDCNRYLKFERLYRRGTELGFDYVVTGHYAIRGYDEDSGRYYLRKGADETKDQSYVLYSLTQDQLAHTLFPLGEYRKTQIREIAEAHDFINARKHDSQDICFVPDGNYVGFLERERGSKYEPGNFVEVGSGEILGQHKGIIGYTIGQRKGLGISSSEPYYVCEKRMETNEVMLGRKSDLEVTRLTAADVNWVSIAEPSGDIRCKAKIRYSHKERPATARMLDGGVLEVIFDEPVTGVAKGQAVVLYDDDYVLGGGTIR